MRFVYDMAELAPGMGKSMGIYNYAVNLFHHLVPLMAPDWEIHVACNEGCLADLTPRQGGARVQHHVVLPGSQPSSIARQVWMRFGAQALARRVNAPVYFTPKGFFPGWSGRPMGLKTVAVLHDLIPLWYERHVPDQFGWLERQVVNGGLLRTGRWADELIVISQATADDLAQHVKRPVPAKVVHNGIPVRAASAERPVAEPYLFAMASALPHKNLSGVLAAYARYRALSPAPLPLLVCGVEDPGVPGVRAVRGLSDEALHAHYAHAEAFVFLSLVEGFGFPPLEAMSHGTPVVCSDIAVFRELTKGAARLVPPDAAEQVARALMEVTNLSCANRQELADRCKRVSALYDWGRCASGVHAVLQGMKP